MPKNEIDLKTIAGHFYRAGLILLFISCTMIVPGISEWVRPTALPGRNFLAEERV
jgi:hypothetical protein